MVWLKVCDGFLMPAVVAAIVAAAGVLPQT
jgi:hypothetical protein